MEKKFWHELNPVEVRDAIESKTWGQIAEEFSPPPWCALNGALRGKSG
jgi:hypothetical protein